MTTRTRKSNKGWPAALERRTNLGVPAAAQARINELHQLARDLLHTHEETLRFISRELHDNIVQVITAACTRLSAAGQDDVPEDVGSELRVIRSELEKTLEDLRALSRQVRPAPVDHVGLAAVIESHAEAFRERSGIPLRVELRSEAIDRLTHSRATALFRIVQEALHNIEKHSGARTAGVALRDEAGRLVLVVSDDGRSFGADEVTEAQKHGRLGLFSMRERAEMLGGTLAIDTRPGHGTTITASIPLAGGPDPHAAKHEKNPHPHR
jgi:signal transduction histidine kinase